MKSYGVRWEFKIKPYMNILNAKAEGNGKIDEIAMLISAVQMIEKAEKFNAYPLPEEPTDRSKSAVAVYFSLIFRRESDINRFIESLFSKGTTP